MRDTILGTIMFNSRKEKELDEIFTYNYLSQTIDQNLKGKGLYMHNK